MRNSHGQPSEKSTAQSTHRFLAGSSLCARTNPEGPLLLSSKINDILCLTGVSWRRAGRNLDPRIRKKRFANSLASNCNCKYRCAFVRSDDMPIPAVTTGQLTMVPTLCPYCTASLKICGGWQCSIELARILVTPAGVTCR